MATPIATPTASQTPMCPAITPNTAPSAAPSAMPSPACFGLLFILTPVVGRAWLAPLAALGRRARVPAPHERSGPSLFRSIPGIRFQGLVADLPYFAQQLSQRHTRKRFEQRRNLRRHLGNVACDLVHPG